MEKSRNTPSTTTPTQVFRSYGYVVTAPIQLIHQLTDTSLVV